MDKKFSETKLGGFLGKVAPAILDTVGEAFPPVKLLKGLIDSDQFISSEDRQAIEKLLREYEIEELRLRLDDVSNARELQKAALTQDDKFSKRFLYYLAAGSLIAGFAYVFFITFGNIPEANQRFADTILGVVIATIITTIYNFFFGSSDGSKKKDEMQKFKG